PGLDRVLGRETYEGFVQTQQVDLVRGGDRLNILQTDTLAVAAVLFGELATGRVNEDSTHRLGRRGQKVAPPVERLIADPSQVRLVDQGGGTQCVAWVLMGELGGGQLSKFAVNERQQFGRGLLIAAICCVE